MSMDRNMEAIKERLQCVLGADSDADRATVLRDAVDMLLGETMSRVLGRAPVLKETEDEIVFGDSVFAWNIVEEFTEVRRLLREGELV